MLRSKQSLSKREEEVLKLTALGYAAKELGKELNITQATVKNHLLKIREKLNARTTCHAVFLYVANRNFFKFGQTVLSEYTVDTESISCS